MPYLLLRTDKSDPLGNGFADCHCAVIDVTAELVKLIRRRTTIGRKAAHADRSLVELAFRSGCEPEFYGRELLSACQAADPDYEQQLDVEGFVSLPSGVALASHVAQRVECQQMLVQIDRLPPSKFLFEIAWSAIPRHTNLTITTAAIPFSSFKESVSLPRR